MARTTEERLKYVDVDTFGNPPNAQTSRCVAIGGNSISRAAGTSIGYNSYAKGSDSIAIGSAYVTTTASKAISIGDGSQALGNSSLAFGEDASVDAAGAVAIGSNSSSSAINAVQFGQGDNTNASTVQYRGQTLANVYGIEARVNSGAPTENARDGSLYVDSATNELYVRIGGSWLKTAPLT